MEEVWRTDVRGYTS